MPKFTLIAEHTDLQGNPDGTKVNYEFYCDYLPEILEHLELFLRGTGFVTDGNLEFVSDEPWTPDVNFDGLDLQHHESYFDTERNK